MSEASWNIIGVTLTGSMILFVRGKNGDKIHPQILTAYWIVFFVISLLPLHMVARLGSAVDDTNYISEVTNISGTRQNESLELAEILDNQQNSSILHKNEVKNLLAAFCLDIWTVGFLLNAAIKILKSVRAGNKIKENCIGIHSCIPIGKRNNSKKVFMKALREDMEYRCDYEAIKNTSINPKEYILHYIIVNGYQSGLKVTLNFRKEQVMKRISRVLDFKVDRKKSLCMSFILGTAVVVWKIKLFIWKEYLK